MGKLEDFNTQTREAWFREWLNKQDFEKDLDNIHIELKRRKANPDWQRPVVLYCVRRQNCKFIKKEEIALVIDTIPWQRRARTAETHWYYVLYRRPATDTEWQEVKAGNSTRRYTVWSYFIQKDWSIDRIVSCITQDDREEYHISGNIIKNIVSAFERFYSRKINIYQTE